MSFAFEGVVRQAAVSSDIPLDDCNWGKSSDGSLKGSVAENFTALTCDGGS